MDSATAAYCPVSAENVMETGGRNIVKILQFSVSHTAEIVCNVHVIIFSSWKQNNFFKCSWGSFLEFVIHLSMT